MMNVCTFKCHTTPGLAVEIKNNRPTNYQTLSITGRFHVSGTVILVFQLNRMFNPNKLKNQNILHLNACFVAMYVNKSS